MRRIAILVSLLVLGLPAGAAAKIIVNRGMFGVKLGAKTKVVRHKLGKPTHRGRHNGKPEWFYFHKKLLVDFRGRRVSALFTESSKERTASGVGVGSSQQDVQQRVPGVFCNTDPTGTVCLVVSKHAVTVFGIGRDGLVKGVLIEVR